MVDHGIPWSSDHHFHLGGVVFGKQECRDMYICLIEKVSMCLCICVCSNFSLKPEDQ